MPQEPKKRHSKREKRVRRGAITLKALKLIVCKNCNERTLSHIACRNCGFYKGRAVGKAQVKVTTA